MIFSVYSTLQHQLHAAFTLVLFRWLVVSINQEMALWLCELLNNADFYFCYVIKMLMMLSSACVNTTVTALPRCTRVRLLSNTINLSPATSFFGENPDHWLCNVLFTNCLKRALSKWEKKFFLFCRPLLVN